MLAFVKAYWLAQPPAVRVLQHMPSDIGARDAKALELAQQGYNVDVPIMVYDWNPYWVMQVRENEGLTDVRDGTGSRALKVSSNIADFPPFDPPPPPPPHSDQKLVGANAFGNVYYSTEAGKGILDGVQVTQDGVNYVKSVTIGLMGATHLFKRA